MKTNLTHANHRVNLDWQNRWRSFCQLVTRLVGSTAEGGAANEVLDGFGDVGSKTTDGVKGAGEGTGRRGDILY